MLGAAAQLRESANPRGLRGLTSAYAVVEVLRGGLELRERLGRGLLMRLMLLLLLAEELLEVPEKVLHERRNLLQLQIL